jgi:hypothetical protein
MTTGHSSCWTDSARRPDWQAPEFKPRAGAQRHSATPLDQITTEGIITRIRLRRAAVASVDAVQQSSRRRPAALRLAQQDVIVDTLVVGGEMIRIQGIDTPKVAAPATTMNVRIASPRGRRRRSQSDPS